MAEFKKYIPNTIIKKIKTSDKDKLISETKKIYLQDIKTRMGGSKFLKSCAKQHGFSESNAFDSLKSFYELSGIYYLVCYFFTSRLNHQIIISQDNPDNLIFPKDLFNDMGLPIWDKKLGLKPKLWNVYKENNKHYFFSYIHENPESKFFDPIIQKFQTYYTTAILNYRIHIDHSIIIESSARDSTQKNRDLGLNHLLNTLNINNTQYMEITDQNIRDFDAVVDQVTYEIREGDTATTSLTRANREADTRNDRVREEIEEREFRKENGTITINGNQYIVSLTRRRKGEIQIWPYLAPQEQINLKHEIFKILNLI